MKQRSRIIAFVASFTLLPMSGYAADAVAAPKADQSAAAAEGKVAAKPKATKAPPSCDTSTASRIRRKPAADCELKDPGVRQVSADELDNTGEMNIGDALRKLDPRLQ